jgi:hypothetical protein
MSQHFFNEKMFLLENFKKNLKEIFEWGMSDATRRNALCQADQ